jgi:hypothetical protein
MKRRRREFLRRLRVALRVMRGRAAFCCVGANWCTVNTKDLHA